MKHWKITGAVLFVMLGVQSYAFAVDKIEQSQVPGQSAEMEKATVQTAYELHLANADKSKFAASLKEKIEAGGEALKKGECEELKSKHGKKGTLMMRYACKKPSAETDEFFRSLIAGHASADCKRKAPTLSLRTYTYAIAAPCVLRLCCAALPYPVSCNLITGKPCAGCF